MRHVNLIVYCAFFILLRCVVKLVYMVYIVVSSLCVMFRDMRCCLQMHHLTVCWHHILTFLLKCKSIDHPQTKRYWFMSFSYTVQYNERFVSRCSTNHPGAPYNNNNKSVRTIKQNSFKSFLEYVSIRLSVMSCKSDGRVFQAAGPE